MGSFSFTSEAQKERTKRYREAKLDRLEVYLPKGQRQIVKEHAKLFQPEIGEAGKEGYSPAGSVSAFVNRAIRETKERDTLIANIKKRL